MGWLGHELQQLAEDIKKFDPRPVLREIEDLEKFQKQCCKSLNDKLDLVITNQGIVQADITEIKADINAINTSMNVLDGKLDQILQILEEPPDTIPVAFIITITESSTVKGEKYI